MKVWYSCKVKSSRETEDGHLKQVTDVYLVDAVSYTEAETRINELVGKLTPGEWSITNISKTNISEVINYEDVDTWYKCKVSYSTIDADSEKETKINTYFLVSANDAKEAFDRVSDNLSSMLVPFDIPSITLTNIYDVFPYIKDEVEQEIPDNLKPLAEVQQEADEDEEDEEEAVEFEAEGVAEGHAEENENEDDEEELDEVTS